MGGGEAGGADAGTDPGADAADVSDIPEVDYELVFDESQVLKLELEIEPADWAAMLADPNSDDYRQATLTFGDERYEGVGVRFKGNSSRWMVEPGSERYSFKIDMNRFQDGQTFHGAKKLNLNNGFNDPSLIREKLANDMFRSVGVPSPRNNFVRLYLNGAYHGLYSNVEQVDKRFLRDRFANDGGNLYKPERLGALVYKGDQLSDYGPDAAEQFDLKTNEEEADYSKLFHFMKVLDELPSSADPLADVSAVLNVDSFIAWLAANGLLVNFDSYAGRGHNYYLYENPDTGKMEFVNWDTNASFGTHNCGGRTRADQINSDVYASFCAEPWQRPMVANLLAIPELRERLDRKLEEVMDNQFTVEALDASISTWTGLIDTAVKEDPQLFFSYEEFLRAPNEDIQANQRTFIGLRPLVEERIPAVTTQIP